MPSKYERAKCSTKTNPYSNLLNSGYVGSTAPSANLDQMTARQVNSCSQFVPGMQTFLGTTHTASVGFNTSNSQTLQNCHRIA